MSGDIIIMEEAREAWIRAAKDTSLANDKVKPDARPERKARPDDTLSVLLPISKIRTKDGTQPRAKMSPGLVEEYAEAMLVGAKFPPVVVFSDGAKYWLADGFHRLAAAVKWELDVIEADVRRGTQRDAVLFSVGANGAHGQRRTNEDKRRAVLRLLNDAEWGKWPNTDIARHCAVDEKTVRNIQASLSSENPKMEKPEVRTVTRGGKTFPMNVGSIGRKPAPPAEKCLSSDTPAAPTGFVEDDAEEAAPNLSVVEPTALPPPAPNHEASLNTQATMEATRELSEAEQLAFKSVCHLWKKTTPFARAAIKAWVLEQSGDFTAQ